MLHNCGFPLPEQENEFLFMPKQEENNIKKRDSLVATTGCIFVIISFFIFPFLSILGIIFAGFDLLLMHSKKYKHTLSILTILTGIIILYIWIQRIKFISDEVKEMQDEYNNNLNNYVEEYNNNLNNYVEEYNKTIDEYNKEYKKQLKVPLL